MPLEFPNQAMIDWRRKHSFTQEEAAAFVGITHSTWVVYETGLMPLPGSVIEAMPSVIPGRESIPQVQVRKRRKVGRANLY